LPYPVYNTYTNSRHINDWKLENDIPQIARFLVKNGITAIKFCPFDLAGQRSGGTYISLKEIDRSLDWIRQIRDTVGNELEIGCEFHSYWNLPSAIRICQSLEPYNVLFVEYMLLQDNMQAYAVLARETPIPVVVSERLATRFQFREMLESKAVDIAMYDLTWCGGISEGKKISDMADTYYVPTVMHTAGGPLLWYSSVHLAAAVTNLFFIESVYQNWHDRYPYFFENVPQVEGGHVVPPEEPGLGLQFKPGLFESDDVMVETVAEI
jgi:L-alanine-DL-glutamate epimerase-like enolase superfamily enzyme